MVMIKKTPCAMSLLILLGSLTVVSGSAVGTDLGESAIVSVWPKNSGMNGSSQARLREDRGDGHLRVTDVGTPFMLYFPAPEANAVQPAMILFPGGGYSHMVVTKMTQIARWLNDRGITAFVLQYQTPGKREAAFLDAQRAVRIVRSRAAEWNIDPGRIGILGSSAGGHLAARVSGAPPTGTYDPIDEIDRASCRPDFTILLYPAYMNRGNSNQLTEEFKIDPNLPPTLMISARDDHRHFKSGEVYAQALEQAGASIRTHFFDEGGHGFGLETEIHPLNTWPELMRQWLSDRDVLTVNSIAAPEAAVSTEETLEPATDEQLLHADVFEGDLSQ